jgi:hypothetical protein
VGPPVTVTPRVVLQQEGSVHVAFTHISSHCIQLRYCRGAALMTVSLLSQRRFLQSVAYPQIVTSQTFLILRLNDTYLYGRHVSAIHGTSLKSCQLGREDSQCTGMVMVVTVALSVGCRNNGVCKRGRLYTAPSWGSSTAVSRSSKHTNTNTTHHDKPLAKCGLCYRRSA